MSERTPTPAEQSQRLTDTNIPVFPVQCIVAPVDFSESSVAAVATALELASAPAGVHVLHVVLPTSSSSPTGEWAPLKEGEVTGTQPREELFNFLERNHFAGVTAAVEFGDPASVVAAYAQKHHADLIVLAAHGYHGLQRMIHGSTTERIIRHCECATFVLHRPSRLAREPKSESH
jgi:nucleotide-binding universal stress UspA family protein